MRISRFALPLPLRADATGEFGTAQLRTNPNEKNPLHLHKTGITFRNLETRLKPRATSSTTLTDAKPCLICNKK